MQLDQTVMSRNGCAPKAWIFDLDNTLYDPEADLFSQMNLKMNDFISQVLAVSTVEANRLRQGYWARHGTTMTGLMVEHDIDPHAFLAHAHDIDLAALRPDPALAKAIETLPGRKLVHTNGSREHAARVLEARGLGGAFDAVVAIEDTELISKPAMAAYQSFLSQTATDPTSAVMIEDHVENLRAPKDLGMATVWLCHGTSDGTPSFVDHRSRNLASFLRHRSS